MVMTYVDKTETVATWQIVGVTYQDRSTGGIEVWEGQVTQQGVTKDRAGKDPVYERELNWVQPALSIRKGCCMVPSGTRLAVVARKGEGGSLRKTTILMNRRRGLQ